MSALPEPLLVLRMVEEQHHRDADDERPIREARTPAALLRDGEIEYRTCPYSGSRNGEPMNVSALKQTGARWAEIIDALVFLRAAYTGARGGAYAPDVLDVWRVSQLGSGLPWFYILRDRDARSPAYAAALSKATLGTGILTQRLFVDVLARQVIPDLSAPALLEAAEWTETMHAEREVCAASEKMILRFLEALVEPGRTYEGVGQVAGIVAQREALLGFGAHYAAFKHLVWMYYLARRFLAADLAHALGDHPLAAGAAAMLEEPCEPPDFFAIDPGAMALLPLEQRGTWFHALALPLVPFAPGGADAELCALGGRLASAMAASPELGAATEVTAEIVRTTGISPAAAAVAGRVLAQFVQLDALFGDVLAATEAGLRAAYGHAALADPVRSVPAAARDRCLPRSPRGYLAGFAPAWLAAHARP